MLFNNIATLPRVTCQPRFLDDTSYSSQLSVWIALVCFKTSCIVVYVGRYFETRLGKNMAAFKTFWAKLQSEKGDQTSSLVGILGRMSS